MSYIPVKAQSSYLYNPSDTFTVKGDKWFVYGWVNENNWRVVETAAERDASYSKMNETAFNEFYKNYNTGRANPNADNSQLYSEAVSQKYREQLAATAATAPKRRGGLLSGFKSQTVFERTYGNTANKVALPEPTKPVEPLLNEYNRTQGGLSTGDFNDYLARTGQKKEIGKIYYGKNYAADATFFKYLGEEGGLLKTTQLSVGKDFNLGGADYELDQALLFMEHESYSHNKQVATNPNYYWDKVGMLEAYNAIYKNTAYGERVEGMKQQIDHYHALNTNHFYRTEFFNSTEYMNPNKGQAGIDFRNRYIQEQLEKNKERAKGFMFVEDLEGTDILPYLKDSGYSDEKFMVSSTTNVQHANTYTTFAKQGIDDAKMYEAVKERDQNFKTVSEHNAKLRESMFQEELAQKKVVFEQEQVKKEDEAQQTLIQYSRTRQKTIDLRGGRQTVIAQGKASTNLNNAGITQVLKLKA